MNHINISILVEILSSKIEKQTSKNNLKFQKISKIDKPIYTE
jgi:hypothetical protein